MPVRNPSMKAKSMRNRFPWEEGKRSETLSQNSKASGGK
jgi:hypothetical protein